MMHVTILSRHDCHLCDVVMRIAQQVQSETSFALTRMNIDEHADLAARYGDRVPVVLINQMEVLSGKITEGDFRRTIKKARERGPISRILSRLRQWLRRG